MSTCQVDVQTDELLQFFFLCCEELDLDQQTQYSALSAYRKFNADGCLTASGDSFVVQEWLCCAVYAELQRARARDMRRESQQAPGAKLEDQEQPRNNCWNVSLTRLLRTFKVNVSQFLCRLEHWNLLAQNTESQQVETNDIRRRLGITLTLRNHYQNIFERIFMQPDGEESAVYNSLYELGWLLFLVVRNELPSFVTTNLVSGCQVLLCSIELMYVNALEMPRSEVIRRNFPGLPPLWDTDDFDDSVLTKYCAMDAICELIPQLPAKGVHQMKKAYFHKALVILFMEQSLLGNDSYMREIFKEGMLDVNLGALNRKYSHYVSDINEMDERVLLSYPNSVAKSGDAQSNRLSVSSNESSVSPHRKLLLQKHPQSLSRSLTDILEQRKEGDGVIVHMNKFLEKPGRTFAAAGTGFFNSEGAEERFRLASGLFYQLLERIVHSELKQRPWLNVVKVMNQRLLKETLIACCVELSLQVHDAHVEELRFPFVLRCYCLDAYDFHKIIDMVVRHGHSLFGRSLVRHLHAVQEQCLESLIFSKNSQMWKSLRRRNYMPSYQDVQPEGKENTATSVDICMRKFYALAKRRLGILCKALGLAEAFPRIWHLAEQSFTHKFGTLLRQRYVDQLLFCAIYMIGRLEKRNVTFSQIIQVYRMQPYARRNVYREVNMDNNRTEDIIGFYNKIYVRVMGSFGRLLQCHKDPSKDTSSIDATNVLREASLDTLQLRKNISVTSQPSLSTCQTPSQCIFPVKSGLRDHEAPKEVDTLKRTLSEKDLTVAKRPNILRRSTCTP
ncbi:hypothetical protein KR018_008648 [Drosophila ironensis]|nr:hypothetical protein KR018_008648 [Drosophila ironensis]